MTPVEEYQVRVETAFHGRVRRRGRVDIRVQGSRRERFRQLELIPRLIESAEVRECKTAIDSRLGMPRIQSKRVIARVQGIFAAPEPEKRLGKIEICVRGSRLQDDQLPIVGDRFVESPQCHQSRPTIQQRGYELGVTFQCAVVVGQRRLMAPHALENQPPVEQSTRVQRREFGGAIHRVERLFEPLLFDQYGCKRVQDRGNIRRELGGAGKGLDGMAPLAERMLACAKQRPELPLVGKPDKRLVEGSACALPVLPGHQFPGPRYFPIHVQVNGHAGADEELDSIPPSELKPAAGRPTLPVAAAQTPRRQVATAWSWRQASTPSRSASGPPRQCRQWSE